MTRPAFSIVFLLVNAVLLGTSACNGTGERVFRAGAHAVDITPTTFPVIVNGGFLSRTATGAADVLYARALVLDDGANRVAITVVDSCMMPRELLDRAKEVATGTTGIHTGRMLISATHTHSAPSVMGALGTEPDPGYPAFLAAKLSEAIAGATNNLAPARVGWTVVRDPEHTRCRRWILRPDRLMEDPFGQRTVRANMHPGFQNPDFIGPAGAVDDGLSILSVQSADGRPIAILGNYSMHYVGVNAEGVSADYYGVFADRIEELIGAGGLNPPFVGIMSQGTSGDQQWMDYGQPRQETDMVGFADAVAQVAYKAYQRIDYHDWVPIKMAETKLSLSRRLPGQERLAWAKQVVAGLEGRLPANRPEVYAREQIYLNEEPVRELKLQALRVGDLGITAIPNEVYGITGLKIKAQSPLQPTFNIELANGSEGYIPPAEQHKLGGYTTWEARTAALEAGAEARIVDTVLEQLEKVSGKPRRVVQQERGPYAQAVLASKPLLYWRLDEFEGSRALDATGKNHHGVYEDGVAFYLQGPISAGFSGEANINRAPHLAGGRIAVALKEVPDPYTVEMWFYNGLPVDARSTTGYLFSMGPGGAEEKLPDTLAIGGTAGARGRLVFTQGSLGEAIPGATDIQVKAWNYLAIVAVEDKVTVYLNGKRTPEISGSRVGKGSSSPGKLFIGGGGDSAANFEGRVDEVAVYPRALPAEEIAAHFAASGIEANR